VVPFLRQRWNDAHIIGIDNSQEMLDRAQQDISQSGSAIHNSRSIQFVNDNQNTWKPRHSVDVIFSNAALQWSPDHGTLFPKLCSREYLKPGGVLAVQMPDVRRQPSFMLMREAAIACGFEREISTITRSRLENDPEFYAKILLNGAGSDVSSLDMWTSTYYQFLEGEDPVPKFTRGSGLIPYLEALGGENSDKGKKFMKQYVAMCAKQYPRDVNGLTLFPFTRFFLVATTKSKIGSF